MRVCKRCGKPFESISGTKLYCSVECSIATDRERVKIKHKEQIEQSCECCGKTFLKTRYSKRIYCTDKCRRDMLKSLGEPVRKKVVHKTKSIAEMQREAREHGMSYGVYDAYLRMQKGV